MAQVWVTTLDNPWDYFTHFDEWYAFDRVMGYNTPEYVARIAMVSSDMSEAEYEAGIEAAVDDICRLNITGNYRKIVKEDKPRNEAKEEYRDRQEEDSD